MPEDPPPTRREFKRILRAFAAEFVVYGALVVGYFLLVLHYLGGWLAGLFHDHRAGYAAASLALVVGQGFVLEELTRVLLKLARIGKK